MPTATSRCPARPPPPPRPFGSPPILSPLSPAFCTRGGSPLLWSKPLPPPTPARTPPRPFAAPTLVSRRLAPPPTDQVCDLGMARARLYGDEADDLATWTDYVTSVSAVVHAAHMDFPPTWWS